MSDDKTSAKIAKFVEKRKSAGIIKLMGKADSKVLIDALKGLGSIGDEDSCNTITHYLAHEDKEVRMTANREAVKIGTEYMKTRVRYQLADEKDAAVKKVIQDALNGIA